MAWEWVAPTVTGLTAVAAIAATTWISDRARAQTARLATEAREGELADRLPVYRLTVRPRPAEVHRHDLLVTVAATRRRERHHGPRRLDLPRTVRSLFTTVRAILTRSARTVRPHELASTSAIWWVIGLVGLRADLRRCLSSSAGCCWHL
jgi:hypothetical protein